MPISLARAIMRSSAWTDEVSLRQRYFGPCNGGGELVAVVVGDGATGTVALSSASMDVGMVLGVAILDGICDAGKVAIGVIGARAISWNICCARSLTDT